MQKVGVVECRLTTESATWTICGSSICQFFFATSRRHLGDKASWLWHIQFHGLGLVFGVCRLVRWWRFASCAGCRRLSSVSKALFSCYQCRTLSWGWGFFFCSFLSFSRAQQIEFEICAEYFFVFRRPSIRLPLCVSLAALLNVCCLPNPIYLWFDIAPSWSSKRSQRCSLRPKGQSKLNKWTWLASSPRSASWSIRATLIGLLSALIRVAVGLT